MGLVIYLIDDAVGNESPKTHGQLALHKSVTTSCSIDNFTTNFIVFRLAIRHEGSHFLKRYYPIFLKWIYWQQVPPGGLDWNIFEIKVEHSRNVWMDNEGLKESKKCQSWKVAVFWGGREWKHKRADRIGFHWNLTVAGTHWLVALLTS